jgi:hypothetical protein
MSMKIPTTKWSKTKVITDENLRLFGDQLKIQDYCSSSWKTLSQWEDLNFVPKDNEERSKIVCWVPVTDENEITLMKNKNGNFFTKTKPINLSLFHKSQVREKKIPNSEDINSYEDHKFYNKNENTFCTITNVIVTYENHKQDIFNLEVWHPLVVDDFGITGKQIMLNILKDVIAVIDFKENQIIDEEGNKLGYAEDLVKISTCTYWLGKLRRKHEQIITDVIDQTRGKFFFQPDQRCEFSNALIEEDSRIASEVMPCSQWLEQQEELKECA